MPFTDDDLKALRLLLREEMQSETHLNGLRMLVRGEMQSETRLDRLRMLVREEMQSETHLNGLRMLVREEMQSETRLNALRLLVREEVQAEIQPFRDDVAQRFDQVATQIDGLYQRDEKREQEYLSIREQLRRLETRFA